LALADPWLDAYITGGALCMDQDKTSVDLFKSVPSGAEVIKTSVTFKKGIIAGIIILLLVLCIGVLLGYAIGSSMTTQHYTNLLQECQNRSLIDFLSV